MRKTLSTRLAVLFGAGALMAAACGDNIKPGGGDDDDDDTVPIDSGPDDPDAMLDVYFGTITFLEVSVFGVPSLGSGIQVTASFFENGGVPPVFEETAGSPLGCKVFEFTPAQVADVGLDEGSVTFVADNDTVTEGVQGPVTPPCSFVAGSGYVCVGGQSTGGAITGFDPANPTTPTACQAGRLLVADADAPFTFAVTDSRYIRFNGTGHPLLPDGTTLPVIGKLNDATIIVFHPQVPATCITPATLPETATLTNLGGIGPIPGQTDLLANGAAIDITVTSGGQGHVATFTSTFAAPNGPGDAFELNDASEAIFDPTRAAGGIPVDGSAFTVGCDETGAGCMTDNSSGDGVVLNIVTTDAEITAGTSLTTMPPPVTKRVQVRCAALISTSVTVPANVSAYLMNSGATKIQATLIRGELDQPATDTTAMNIVTGHAITTFQVIPAATAN